MTTAPVESGKALGVELGGRQHFRLAPDLEAVAALIPSDGALCFVRAQRHWLEIEAIATGASILSGHAVRLKSP
jgi:hypothetical protein